MIILLALAGGMVFTPALVAAARKRVSGADHGGHDHAAMVGVSPTRQDELEAEPWATKLRSPAAWSDASSYAVADVTMLRKELVIGYTVAGLLAVLVPTHVWNALFLQGHGFWTTLENAMVGPIIAVLSWVCSIGNVPLAAALWGGGISFGGVIAFIFADLIAMPLILIYRKFYGWRLTVRLVGLLYVVMVIAGLATELIFRAFGAVPANRAVDVAPSGFEWNYTTYLNLVFLVVAGAVWWLARNRARFGGGRRVRHRPGVRHAGPHRGRPGPGRSTTGPPTPSVPTGAATDSRPTPAASTGPVRRRSGWRRHHHGTCPRGRRPRPSATARPVPYRPRAARPRGQPFFRSCEKGRSLSFPGSFGSPRTRSPMMFRCTWSVPP